MWQHITHTNTLIYGFGKQETVPFANKEHRDTWSWIHRHAKSISQAHSHKHRNFTWIELQGQTQAGGVYWFLDKTAAIDFVSGSKHGGVVVVIITSSDSPLLVVKHHTADCLNLCNTEEIPKSVMECEHMKRVWMNHSQYWWQPYCGYNASKELH